MMQWFLTLATVVYFVPSIVFGSEAANRFVDFSLEDPHEKSILNRIWKVK